MIPSRNKMYKNLQELYNHWELDDDIQHPLTFTGKINWNKINGDLNVMAKLADKQEVKAWIQEKLDYSAPTTAPIRSKENTNSLQ